MGGSIRVVHVVDGKIDVQTRHTNALPEYVKHHSFIHSEREWIKTYLNRESDFRQKKEHFAPEGYGIDVFDFDRKEIYSIQGYCEYDHIDISAILYYILDIRKELFPIGDKRIEPIDLYHKNSYPYAVKRMWDEGLLDVVMEESEEDFPYNANHNTDKHYYDIIVRTKTKEELGNISFEEAILMIDNYKDWKFNDQAIKSGYTPNKSRYPDGFPMIKGREFKINWEKMGWKIKSFHEDSDGLKAFFDIIKSQYNLTKAAEKIWLAEISEKEQFELEHDEG